MRLTVLLFLAACTTTGPYKHSPDGNPYEAGRLQNSRIREASGIARSHRHSEILWAINDSGSSPVLFAIGSDGSDRGSVRLKNAVNFDWEDIASFEIDGKPWLLVADIGDNFGFRSHVSLYLIEEPELPQTELRPSRKISFEYPDTARDAEAIAVDIAGEQILILSKRTVPPVLYSVPLNPTTDEKIIARRLGQVSGIPQPTDGDLNRPARKNDWHWQPTGMDISADGNSAVILTYEALYRFSRQPGDSWYDTFQSEPHSIDMGDIALAEAVAFSKDGKSIFVTAERQNAPLLRFEISQ